MRVPTFFLFLHDLRPRIAPLLTRGIPDLPAEVVGFLRIIYSAFLFVALSDRRLRLDGRDEMSGWAPLDWLLQRPDVVARLETTLLVLLVIFAVGLFTRLTYALLAAGLTIWIAVMLQGGTNIHAWEVAFLTVLCLIPVAWGAAFSVDETLRRWRGVASGPGVHGKAFGFAVWMPGFILGTVWAGAAYTKVRVSGLDWILGGAVKYHWVIDAPQAAVDWGLWVASHHWAAVVMSFFGIVLEGAFILAAFASTTRARTLLASLIGGSLVAGFYLFHGVLWWTWLLVLLIFAVPWQALFDGISALIPERAYHVDPSHPDSRRRARLLYALDWFNKMTFVDATTNVRVQLVAASVRRSRPLGLTHACLAGAICLLMVRELPEGFGRFTSYSNTYASTADFDARGPIKPVDHLWIGYGTSSAVEVLEGSNDSQLLAGAILRLRSRDPLRSGGPDALGEIQERLQREHGDTRVTLVRERDMFDWEGGRFLPPQREVIGTLELSSMTFSAGAE